MKRHYPLPITKPWGAPTSLPGKFCCRDDTFLSGRSEILFITRLIGSAVDTRETSTRQAKRVRGQQASSYAFSSLELEPGWYSRKKRIEPGLAEPFCPSIQRTYSCAKRCRLFNDIVRKSRSIGESHRIVLDSSI